MGQFSTLTVDGDEQTDSYSKWPVLCTDLKLGLIDDSVFSMELGNVSYSAVSIPGRTYGTESVA